MKSLPLLLASASLCLGVTPHDIRVRQLNSTATGEVVYTLPYPTTGTVCTVLYDVATKLPLVAAPWDSSVTYDAVSGSMGVDEGWLATVPAITAKQDASTAFSGVYADLTGKPTLFSGAYADLTGKPSLFDGTWGSLSGKPSTFTPSSHVHSWADITSGKPTTLSGYGITDGFTTANARSAISLTTTGSGAATYNSSTGVLNVPTPAADLITGVTSPLAVNSGTLSIGSASTIVAGTMSASDKAKLDALPTIQRTTITTNTSGVATWTFPTAFGVVPRIACTPNDSAATTQVDVKITAKSATSVTIQVNKLTPVLGVLTLLTSTNIGATDVEIIAVSQ